MAFAGDEWFPSRLSFGKFKGRLYQEAREDAELRWAKAEISKKAETLKFQRPPEFFIKGSAASPQAA